MTRWPSLIVIARAVAESIPPDKSTTAVSTIGIGMDTGPKGLASGKLTGRAFRSPARIDRPAGPHVDGLPSRDEVLLTDRFHVLRGRAGRPPDRTVAARGLRGTPLTVCSIPRTSRLCRPPRRRGNLRGPPDPLRAGIDGWRAEPSRRRSGRRGLRRGGAASRGRLD